MALVPSFSAVAAVIDHTPAVTVPVPIVVLPSNRVTLAPSSPVPLKVGNATPVMLSVLDTPLSDPAARSGVPGATGATTPDTAISVPLVMASLVTRNTAPSLIQVRLNTSLAVPLVTVSTPAAIVA